MSLAAEQVESTAGTLKEKISSTSITTLTVTGEIDASDIDFINNSLTELKTLDLSAATIAAYHGEMLSNGRNSSAANTLPEYLLIGSPIESIKLPDGLKCLADGCLAASSITSVSIPEYTDSIGCGIFNNCTALTHVTLPESITRLPDLVFKNCKSLIDITLPQALEAIGNQAFMGCTTIESIKLPEKLQFIGTEAFNNCKSLNDIQFSKNLNAIGDMAFGNTSVASIDMTACTSLKSLGCWTFAHCGRLEEAILPGGLTTLGDGLFFDCNQLTTIIMPTNITRLAPYMFKGAGITDTELIVNDKLNDIGDYALYGNENITAARLPGSISSLGDKALAGLSSLTMLDVTDLKELPSLGEDVFEGTAGQEVTLSVSQDMATAFKTAPQWQEFNIVTDENAGITAIGDDTTSGNMSLKLRHDGNTLWINAPHVIDSLTISDLQGHTLARSAGFNDTTASIATYNIPRGVVIVTVQYDNTARTNIKIIL